MVDHAAAASALLTPDDVELIAQVGESLEVTPLPSLEDGVVVVCFGSRRVALTELRSSVDPVGLVRDTSGPLDRGPLRR